MPSNPAHSVRGSRYSVSKGSTPALSSEEARALLESIAVKKKVKRYGMILEDPLLVSLRDRALIAVMTYTFARVGAVVALAVEDYYPQNKRWWLRLREKTASSTKCPAITSWKSIWTPTLRRRAFYILSSLYGRDTKWRR